MPTGSRPGRAFNRGARRLLRHHRLDLLQPPNVPRSKDGRSPEDSARAETRHPLLRDVLGHAAFVAGMPTGLPLVHAGIVRAVESHRLCARPDVLSVVGLLTRRLRGTSQKHTRGSNTHNCQCFRDGAHQIPLSFELAAAGRAAASHIMASRAAGPTALQSILHRSLRFPRCHLHARARESIQRGGPAQTAPAETDERSPVAHLEHMSAAGGGDAAQRDHAMGDRHG